MRERPRSRGGYAAAANMTAQQRQDRARKGSLTAAVNVIVRRAAELSEEQRSAVFDAINQT